MKTSSIVTRIGATILWIRLDALSGSAPSDSCSGKQPQTDAPRIGNAG